MLEESYYLSLNGKEGRSEFEEFLQDKIESARRTKTPKPRGATPLRYLRIQTPSGAGIQMRMTELLSLDTSAIKRSATPAPLERARSPIERQTSLPKTPAEDFRTTQPRLMTAETPVAQRTVMNGFFSPKSTAQSEGFSMTRTQFKKLMQKHVELTHPEDLPKIEKDPKKLEEYRHRSVGKRPFDMAQRQHIQRQKIGRDKRSILSPKNEEKTPLVKKEESVKTMQNNHLTEEAQALNTIADRIIRQTREHFEKKKKEVQIRKEFDYNALPKWFQERIGISYHYSSKKYTGGETIADVAKIPDPKRSDEQKERLFHWLRNIKFFHSLPDDINIVLVSKLSAKEFLAGELVLPWGKELNSIAIINEGALVLKKKGDSTHIQSLEKGMILGREALEAPLNLEDDVYAAKDSILFFISRFDYHQTLEKHIELSRTQLMDFLTRTSLFSGVPWLKLEVLTSFLICKFYLSGELVFEEGEHSDLLCILYTGKLQKTAPRGIETKRRWPIAKHTWKLIKTSKVVIGASEICPGDIFGEYEFFCKGKRREKITCLEDACVLYIRRNKFYELFDKDYVDKWLMAKGWTIDEQHKIPPEEDDKTNVTEKEEKVESAKLLLDLIRTKIGTGFENQKQNEHLIKMKGYLHNKMKNLHKTLHVLKSNQIVSEVATNYDIN